VPQWSLIRDRFRGRSGGIMSNKSILACVLCGAFLFSGSLLSAQQAPEDPGQKALTQFSPGVLNVVVYDKDAKDKKELAKGSAIVLTKEIAAVNYHLISLGNYAVAFNFKKKEVDVLGVIAVDKAHDLALIKIDGKVEPLVPAAAPLAEGQKVLVLGANETGDIIVSGGSLRSLLDLGDGVKIADASVAVPDTFGGAPVLTEDGKLVGMMVIGERRLRFVAPIAAVSALNKAGKFTTWKAWIPEDYTSSIEMAWLAGRVYKWMDEALNAQRNLEKVTKAQPANLEAWILLADVYNRQRDYANALIAFKKIIELDPNNSAAYLGLGDIQVRMQKPLDAAQNLEKALALDPSKNEAKMFLGNAYEDAREWVKAADAYEKYLAGNPANAWTIYQRMGMCRLEAQQFDQAAAALSEALKSKPQDQSIAYKLAQAYERGGKLGEAEDTYKKLVELSPKDAPLYYQNILAMYDKSGNSAKAVDIAKKLIEIAPQNEQWPYTLGSQYIKMQKYPEAIAAFKKAIEIKPNYDWAWFQIGYCYYVQKLYAEALPNFQKNVEIVPDHFYGYTYIGMCYMQTKQFAKALDSMKKATELKPDDGQALFNLGVIYLNLKDKFSAQEMAKKLQSIDSGLAAKLRGYIK
jgi:tetratricopeptide (TPR) repeat protein